MRLVMSLLICLIPPNAAADLDPFALRRISDFEDALARVMPRGQWTEVLRVAVRRALEAEATANRHADWYRAARSRTPWTKRTRRAFAARARVLGDRFALEVRATALSPVFSPEYVEGLARALRTLAEVTALAASYPGNEVAQFNLGVLATVVPATAALTGASLTLVMLTHPAGISAADTLTGGDGSVVFTTAAAGAALATLGLAATDRGRRSMIAMAHGRGRDAGAERILAKFRARVRDQLESDPSSRGHLTPAGGPAVEMNLIEKLFMFGDGAAACARWLGDEPAADPDGRHRARPPTA